ncbi:branched-chain amino acid ABC transporter permease [Halococcus sediminicola]|uniref:branched-chain amino acid ABC transporter permease n=1 Tax=Halococcus sediminicola TaxID=1264579 RepID=UPI000678BF50|nr:branched-chain amino acid ABC transporter permease [Halococcus sediminicola]
MSDEPTGRTGTDGGTANESVGEGETGFRARWQAVRDRETTVFVLTVLGVVLFPYLFARAPVISPALQGYQELASLMLIWGIFAIGFNLVLGYTGLLSFGHAAFWGVAAYAAGWVSANVVGSPVVLVLVGTVAAVVLAWLFGVLSLRRGGIYFAILTLAFAQMIYYVALGPLSTLTGGENGFTDVEIGELFGTFDLGSELPSIGGLLLGNWMYAFIGLLTVLSVVVLYRILNSPYGLVFRAIRENEQRAEFVGLDVRRYKLMSFVLSGAFAGVAGSLFTIHGGYVPLESLYWTTSGEVVIMTVLGGVGSIIGPMIGAALYLYVEVIVSGFDTIGPFWHLILGLVFVAVVVFAPRGIWGLLTDAGARLTGRDR